jgi:hypothetical protein
VLLLLQLLSSRRSSKAARWWMMKISMQRKSPLPQPLRSARLPRRSPRRVAPRAVLVVVARAAVANELFAERRLRPEEMGQRFQR